MVLFCLLLLGYIVSVPLQIHEVLVNFNGMLSAWAKFLLLIQTLVPEFVKLYFASAEI